MHIIALGFVVVVFFLIADDSTTVKKVVVHNPIHSELYDEVGEPPQIIIPPVPVSVSDTTKFNTISPLIGMPTPLLHAHHGNNGIHHYDNVCLNI